MDQQSAFSEEKKWDLKSLGKKLESNFLIFRSKTIFEIQEKYRRFEMKHFDLQ